jgi:hypothetical protein
MASTNLVKQNDKLEASLSTVRKKLKESEDEFIRKGAGLASGFVIGALEKNGKLAQMPTIPGVPRIVTLGILFNGAAMFAPKGKLRQALDGAGESALNVASYKWGKGEDVAGVGEADVGGPRARARRTDQALRDTQAQVRELEAQLSAQLNEANSYEAPPYYQGYGYPG